MSSKMKAGHWTPELELKLVKIYKKCPCLWMINSPAYNDLDRRYAAYVKIVEILRPDFRGLTVPMVVYKIRDLRYRYCVELTKIERAAGCGQNYTPIVPWFSVMQSFLNLRFRTDELKNSQVNVVTQKDSKDVKFFHDYNGLRLTRSTCKIIYENNLRIEESKSTVGEFEESGNHAENSYARCDVYDLRRRRYGARVEESELVLQQIGDHLDDLTSDKKNTEEKENSEIIKMVEKTTKILVPAASDIRPTANSEEISAKYESDEFDAFAMSIGSQLRTLSCELVKKLQIMILVIVNGERTRSVK